MVRESLFISALLALALPGTASAAQASPSWPRQVRDDLVRLGHVEWRLRREAADICPRQASAVGFALDYIGAYDEADRAYVQAETGLSALPRILSVEPGSPAALAGLEAGDEVLALAGVSVSRLLEEIEDEALLADALQDRIGRMPAGGSLAMKVLRKGRQVSVRVQPTRVCSARFVFKTDETVEAYSDGTNVAVNWGLMRFVASDDELALVAGHELGHVMAGEKGPSSLFGRRKMEDEADLAGARLVRCAGFDLNRALAFWDRFARMDTLGWLRNPTHRSARGRYERLRAAAVSLTCKRG